RRSSATEITIGCPEKRVAGASQVFLHHEPAFLFVGFEHLNGGSSSRNQLGGCVWAFFDSGLQGCDAGVRNLNRKLIKIQQFAKSHLSCHPPCRCCEDGGIDDAFL